MSLQGSLETFALPDVLVLLSSTKKDGELRVVGGRVDGRIWLEKGQIVHSSVGGAETSAVDGLFQLLRLDSGTFNFDGDSAPESRSAPEAIDLVLADAQVRLGEWKEIARVVPHLDVIVDMAAESPADEVVVTREHWRLLRTVAGGRSVLDLMRVLGRSEFDTCKTVKELIDAELASVDASAAPKAGPETAQAHAKAASAKPEPEAKPPAKAPAPAAAARRVDPFERDSEALAADRPKQPTVSATTSAGPARKTDARDQLEALAEMASRPSKIRASTSTDREDEQAPPRPAATKNSPADPDPAEEARALVAQLAALSGQEEEEVAAKVTEHLASGGELPDVADPDEPINRGMLLKFLSSVRN